MEYKKKFKLKKNFYANITLIGIFLIVLAFAFSTSFYMQSLADRKVNIISNVIKTNKSIEKNEKIKEYVDDISENLIDEVDFKKEVTGILSIEKNRYNSKIFDYETGEELGLDRIIKEENLADFWQVVEKLLHLKYPTFIADVLKWNDHENVYYLRENELIIYYYDYIIDPMPNEDLYIRVNYNEIKDYLNITVDLDAEYKNEDGSVIDLNKKIIAITFDDGPGPYTLGLVNILKNNKAKATFFMLGKNLNIFQDEVRAVYNNGFEIGYHSYAHTSFKRQKTDEIQSEFELSNKILKSITGSTFSLVRPPYGAINQEIKNSLDLPFVLWSVDTEDWRYKDVNYLTNYVLDNADDGDIILFHDIHKTSVETIEKLLPSLYVNGFQVVTVTQLAEFFDTTLENNQAYRYFVR